MNPRKNSVIHNLESITIKNFSKDNFDKLKKRPQTYRAQTCSFITGKKEKAQFVELFKDILTGRRKYIEFTEDGDLIENDLGRFHKITEFGKRFSTDTINTQNSFKYPISHSNNTSDVKKIHGTTKYISTFRLPVCERSVKIISVNNCMKNSHKKKAEDLKDIKIELASYNSFKLNCRMMDKKLEEKEKRNLMNIKALQELQTRNKSNKIKKTTKVFNTYNGDVKFTRQNSNKYDNKTYFERYIKEPISSIPLGETTTKKQIIDIHNNQVTRQ